ncbi:MAG: PIN domain-containing protein [Spirobacillus cienkowskii]|uniref:PIN domain-containing protein n=1 Tax=Spirobacillus cienkowskii TaxID=495820 RepID=A0A369KVH1_9BACT|nr:MAG: PIN domain-containing protein [Spirobacillus cienkowskii]
MILKVVIDTSFLINLMITTEPKHKKCEEYFYESMCEFIAPDFILIEIASYFVRVLNLNLKQLNEHINEIKSLINIHTSYNRYEDVLDTIYKYKTRGADSLFVKLADKYKCELLTCDKDQAVKYEKSILF